MKRCLVAVAAVLAAAGSAWTTTVVPSAHAQQCMGVDLTCGIYWDYEGNLDPGHSYGEAQAGTSGYWYIRLERSNCSADSWLRRRSDGAWEWLGVPCSYSEYTTQYALSTHNASKAMNGSSSTLVYVRVRIADSV